MIQPSSARPVHLFGVPMDLGQNRRGVDMGPSALRYAGLQRRLQRLGLDVRDGGNVSVPVAEEITNGADSPAHHVEAIATVSQRVDDHMRAALAAGQTAIFLGGDHSMSLGTIPAVLQHHERAAVLWIDAHGDFNTPATSPSGNVHGMVVSSLLGLCPDILHLGEGRLRPEQIVMIGVRDLDPQERSALRRSDIKVLTMRDIDERGMAAVMRETLAALEGADAIHVSFDLDSLDPSVAPGVGTPVPGGLSYREAHLLMELLADDGRVRSLDVVEINPILDDGNHTAEVAVALVASLFGQQIL